MPPTVLLTVKIPFETCHIAGFVLSPSACHASRFVPLNKIIVSEDASCGVAPKTMAEQEDKFLVLQLPGKGYLVLEFCAVAHVVKPAVAISRKILLS